jgi:hypothetical protein
MTGGKGQVRGFGSFVSSIPSTSAPLRDSASRRSKYSGSKRVFASFQPSAPRCSSVLFAPERHQPQLGPEKCNAPISISAETTPQYLPPHLQTQTLNKNPRDKMAEHTSTPRITAPYLDSHVGHNVILVGKVVQLRGDSAVIDADGNVTAILNRVSRQTRCGNPSPIGSVAG